MGLLKVHAVVINLTRKRESSPPCLGWGPMKTFRANLRYSHLTSHSHPISIPKEPLAETASSSESYRRPTSQEILQVVVGEQR